MREFAYALLLPTLALLVPQQTSEKWQRVYTGEDSIVEMEVSRVVFAQYAVSKKVTFASNDVARVSFRTKLARPAQVTKESATTYKTRVETIEFNCRARRYRLFKANLFDANGTMVKKYEQNPDEEWHDIKFGSMMARFSDPACKLIDEKRRNP
jgi:hypothetical protein